jgi:hypothetical protein
MDRILKRNYYDLNYPTAFTSASTIKKKFKNEFTPQEIDNWAQKQDIITKFAPVKRNFSRQITMAHTKNQIWHLDLADMSKESKKTNLNFRYFCVCVDVLSKMTYAFKLKSKKPEEVVKNLKRLFKTVKPKVIFSDSGGEFTGRVFTSFLKNEGGDVWKSRNTETKASIAENKILWIKKKLHKYMRYTESKNWINALDNIIRGFNHSYHRTIKMRPIDVKTKDDEKKAFLNAYGKRIGIPTKPSAFKPDDKVRISHLKKLFTRGYMQTYSDEKFTLKKVIARDKQNLFVLEDENQEPVIGKFYASELQKTI